MRVLASQLPGAYQGPWVRPTPPIFVIGNTMDPSTPYSGSVTMARQLANARLLTVQGHGHTEFPQPEHFAPPTTDADDQPGQGADCDRA
jgi:pimeloyl-ACP methyl ester carboxylesterase